MEMMKMEMMKMEMMNTSTTANQNDEIVIQIWDKLTANVINVPEELTIEIISRLPTRSIGRLRCISKSWLTISTSNSFIKSHSQRCTNHNSLIIEHRNQTNFHFASADSKSRRGFSIYNPTRKQRIQDTIIKASWNGFLLLRNSITFEHSLFNPLTYQSITLPNNAELSALYLCLYHHRPTSKYRLIRLRPDKEYWSYTEVLVVGESNWRFINSRIPYFSHHRHPVEFNGQLYWLAVDDGAMSVRRFRTYKGIPTTIMTFDTETEVYNTIPLPLIKETHNLGGNLIDFNGELGLWNIGLHFLDLWIMERRCNWVKRYSVDFLNVSSVRERLSPLLREPEPWPLGVAVPAGDEELLIDLSATTMRGSCLLWVNMKNGASRVGSWWSRRRHFVSFAYVESIAHVDCYYSLQTLPQRQLTTAMRYLCCTP